MNHMEITSLARIPRRSFLQALLSLATVPNSLALGEKKNRGIIYIVPNTHDDCLGWLAPYPIERNYALYSYLDHQDLAMKDPNYKYVFSEIPNLIAMMELEPSRFEELKGLIQQGRVELANAFVLEPTINLAGGEALVMQGVEGLRWYAQVMNASPRHCYMIDITGWHEQMAQIVTGLGLESFIYCRYNPFDKIPEDNVTSGDAVHWIESPEGTRALAVNPGHYVGALRYLMQVKQPVDDAAIRRNVQKVIDDKRPRYPQGCPILALAGENDYSLAFAYKGYPAEVLKVWAAGNPDTDLEIATLKDWFDAAKPDIDAGKYDLKVWEKGSMIYGFSAFWVNAPKSKQWYRRGEHALQSAESLATVASLQADFPYPSQDLSDGWMLLALNMDRGPLWGIAVSGVYEHEKAWDVRDRYEALDAIASKTTVQALPALLGKGNGTLGLFNSCNWERGGLFDLRLPAGKSVQGAPAQMLEDGRTTLVNLRLPSLGVKSIALRTGPASPGKEAKLPETIETDYYSAQVDPATGALVSVKLKPSRREILGGPANVILAQLVDLTLKPEGKGPIWQAHFLPERAERKTVISSSGSKPQLHVSIGPLATILEMTCPFSGGDLRRVIRFYRHSPRIDIIGETQDLPDRTIIAAEFPLKEDITEFRRGIPYGFAQTEWADLNAAGRGNNVGIIPVIRWSHYTLRGGGGVALLDRGVPGRELVDRTAIILLHNALDRYFWDTRTNWMSGKAKQSFEYALLAHDAAWGQARIPQQAWDYNAPPLVLEGANSQPGKSYLESSDNVLIEALRRTGDEIEIRLVETRGVAGNAEINVMLPHRGAALTNLLGKNPVPLSPASSTEQGGATYQFDIRPQQIVTLRLKTPHAVAPVEALRHYDSIMPEGKRLYTRTWKHPELKGHPPQAGVPVWNPME